MQTNGISNSVIKRLPRYYRFLGELKREGISRISSRELSERMGEAGFKKAQAYTASMVSTELLPYLNDE